MSIELELLDIEIAKIQSDVNDTSIGISLLGTFFLTIIPVFYGIMGIYNLTFENIQIPLIIAVAVVFTTTLLAVLRWEQNTQKLKKLYALKTEILTNAHKEEESKNTIHKTKKR